VNLARAAGAAVVVGGVSAAAVAGHGAWAAAAAGCVAAAATLAAGAWLVAPYEHALTALEDVARTGLGAVPGDDLASAVRVAIDQRERAHLASVDALRSQAKVAWEALDTSPFGILLVDDEGRITWVNDALGRMLHLRNAPVGRRPLEVASVVELHEAVERVLADDAVVELPATTQDRDLSIRATRLPSRTVVVRLEDVTTAREAERSRTDFVANVSHELRTPVASILGYLDLALADRGRLPEDVVPLLETALRNGRRLRDLFEDLLKLHRIEARRRELPRTRVDLSALVAEVVATVRDKAAMRQQTVTLECPPGLEVRVNPEALSQILSNLVSNASAYSPEGQPIAVRVTPEPKEIRIDVVDRGIGIAEKHHERIFERFYRVDEARSRKAGGTGLGLAIVKHYAKASGCTVSLTSREGAGSTFTVRVPTDLRRG
jgi:two-component system phosphate regulon sensor histidine kinase PhoR